MLLVWGRWFWGMRMTGGPRKHEVGSKARQDEMAEWGHGLRTMCVDGLWSDELAGG